jgi:hypothetical protein
MVTRNPPGRKKGTPKTGGRRKGTPNKVTVEVREASALIVDDAIYRRHLLARARAGKLAPAMECLLWYYRYGKPTEERNQKHTVDLAQLLSGDFSDDE